MNSTKRRALLNKVYRAVHDHVCPKCGNRSVAFFGNVHRCVNEYCDFSITEIEMLAISDTVREWGQELCAALDGWRTEEPQ